VPECARKRTLTLGARQRLRDPAEFQRVYEAQEALHGPSMVIFFKPNGLAYSRLGVSVGRKHGNAVRRNRIKRVLREAYRRLQHHLPSGLDYVLIPRRGVKQYRTAEVLEILEGLARKIPLAGEGTRSAVSRAGENKEEAAGSSGAKRRRGISKRIFIKRPPPKP